MQLEVGVADHVEQDKSVGVVHFFRCQILGPCLGPEGVSVVLVLSVVEEQHHLMAQGHVGDVASEFEENSHTAGGIVGSGDR